MRRRLRWIIPAAIVLLTLCLALRPRTDPYDFLRKLRPIETVRRMESPFTASYFNVRVFSFTESPPEVEDILLAHYFTGRRKNFGLPEFAVNNSEMSFEWTSDGSWPEGVQCQLTVREEPTWFQRQIDATKRWLHLP